MLTVMMVFGLFAAMTLTAHAVNSETLLKDAIANGTASEIKLTGNITIGDPGVGKNGLDITRNVTLDLNGKTLSISTTSEQTNGIKIPSGKTLTVKDSVGGGKLIVKVEGDHLITGFGAAIFVDRGTLTIESGTIEATGGSGGAGIGSGYYSFGGTINILGGTVNATGVSGSAAGIGFGGQGRDGMVINISGGNVTATGCLRGAGIGNGENTEDCTVNISGDAVVNATGGPCAAGIGGRVTCAGAIVNISGGIVTATGGNGEVIFSTPYDPGPGIGGGGGKADGTTPDGAPGTLKITGGSLFVKAGSPLPAPQGGKAPEDATRIATDGTNPVERVEVTVTDIANSKLEGVALSVGSYKTVTDANGKAYIWIPSPGDKQATFVKDGYVTVTEGIFKIIGRGFVTGVKMVASVNTPPKLKSDVSATATKSVAVNTVYTLDLSTIFEDANAGDALTYKVSIDGGASVTAEQNYSYTPTAEGTKILIFKANDGTVDSTDTYTVALTATATSSTGMSNFTKVKAYTRGQFTDVDETLWYGLDEQEVIANAYEYGLMKGDSSTTFNPAGNMTIAEAIAVAARVHKIYATGNGDFEQGSVWYQVYVDYAVANNIIAANDFANYSKAATRAEMAYIFSESLPAAEFPSQNTVNSLPDVNNGTPYYSAILTLYKAGVLAGSDAQGTFNPSNNIIRAEAAAIISRVILPATRFSGKTF